MTIMCFGLCLGVIVVLMTAEEHQHLLTHSQQPISGGIPVELKAGDGVVYTHIMLH